MHSVTYLDNRGVQTAPGVQASTSLFLCTVKLQPHFSCWNVFWNFLRGFAGKRTKKAFALCFFSNLFSRLQPAVQVIFLTVPWWYITIPALPELMRRWATLRAPAAYWCIFIAARCGWRGRAEIRAVTFCLRQSGRSITPASYIIKPLWDIDCWLWPQECWVALYSHKVSHHSSCGHISLNGHWADLWALKSWEVWIDSGQI